MKSVIKYSRDECLSDPHVNGVYYPVSYWTERGGRPYQEDRVAFAKGVNEVDSSLYGVFDGHGGSCASQFCKENLLKCILEDNLFCTDVKHALKRAFHRLRFSIFPMITLYSCL